MKRNPAAWRSPHAYNYTVAADGLRRVLNHLTEHPGATRRETAAAVGLSLAHVNRAIDILTESGYVERRSATARATVVRVPFSTRFRVVAPEHPGLAATEAD